MNTTTSLIFIPRDAIYVKKSLTSDIFNNSVPKSPLLRNVNSKNRKADKPISTPAVSKQRPQQNSKPGEKKYIINRTASPILTGFFEKDFQGNITDKPIVIKGFLEKSKFTEDQLNSYELKVLYDNNLIFDGSYEEIPKKERSNSDDSGQEILDRKYKSREVKNSKDTFVRKVGDKEQSITITEDLHYNDRSVIEEDDSEETIGSRGLTEMFSSAENEVDGPIDDLIPTNRIKSSGSKGTVRRA